MSAKSVALLTMFALTFASSPSWAWGPKGHQTVGAIADSLLTVKAKKAVKDKLGISLAEASVWLDCAKGVHNGANGFEYHGNPKYQECVVFESDEGQESMKNYVERNWDTCGLTKECHTKYHFTDVAMQHAEYDDSKHYHGASKYDVVHAINAAIAKLKGQAVPEPFNFDSDEEAILALAHLVGDVHQPLHAGAIYLANDQPIDPDQAGVAAGENTETHGGNFIGVNKNGNLHALWDDVPDSFYIIKAEGSVKPKDVVLPTSQFDLQPGTKPVLIDKIVVAAKKTLVSPGTVETWSTIWASESIAQSQKAFKGMTFSDVPNNKKIHWKANFSDRAIYSKDEAEIQQKQIAKAGARLAQLLNAIFK